MGMLVSATVPSLISLLFVPSIPAAAVITSVVTAAPAGITAWILFTRYVYHQVLDVAHVLLMCIEQDIDQLNQSTPASCRPPQGAYSTNMQVTLRTLQLPLATLLGVGVELGLSTLILIAWTLIAPDKDPALWDR